MGHGGYVDTEQIIHLLVDDVELPPKNAHSGVLDANETWDTDALFIIPANVNRVGLIVGRSKDAPSFLERLLASFSRQRTGTAKIPIETSLLPKPAPQAPAGSESAP
jgi:hypothetical protein